MLKHLRQPITYYTFSLSPMVDQKTCGGISLYFLSKMIMLRLSNVRFSFILNQRKHGLKCNVCHSLCTHFVTKNILCREHSSAKVVLLIVEVIRLEYHKDFIFIYWWKFIMIFLIYYDKYIDFILISMHLTSCSKSLQ